MHFELSFDPFEILGVSSRDSLESLREAYRSKARRHHPDTGGEDWSFRVVKTAYEILSEARVLGRAAEELTRPRNAGPGETVFRSEPVREEPTVSPSESNPFVRPETETAGERVRPGVRDKLDDPSKLVDVELFIVRFELEDVVELLTVSAERRNLSCSLQLNWPGRDWREAHPGQRAEPTLSLAVAEVFDSLAAQYPSAAAHAKPSAERFSGWLSFPTVAKASDAVKTLRTLLHDRGLGLVQTIREAEVARDPA